jgi:hypothetical protein
VGEVTNDNERGPGSSALSRRAALRAGVAAGVGVAVWSGATITSFGGTPAYAAACTGAIPPVNVSGGCRNTTQASGCDPFGYQPFDFPNVSGYELSNAPNNTCCNVNTAGTLTHPAGTTCTLVFTFYDSKCGTAAATLYGSSTFGPSAATPMPFTWSCPQTVVGAPNWANTQYTVSANCFTGTTPPPSECF